MGTTAPEVDLSKVFVVERMGFIAEGIRREVGEVVFTDKWVPARAEQMVKTLYMAPAPYSLLSTIETCDCGRAWRDEAAKIKHDKLTHAPAKES